MKTRIKFCTDKGAANMTTKPKSDLCKCGETDCFKSGRAGHYVPKSEKAGYTPGTTWKLKQNSLTDDIDVYDSILALACQWCVAHLFDDVLSGN